MLSIVPRVFATVLCLCVVVPAEAALLGRLPATAGGTDYRAAYDTVLDITWTTDANINGPASWAGQVAWADGFSLGGANDWRLASMSVLAGVPTDRTTSVVGCSSAMEEACRDNELGYMFYHNLGGSHGDNLTGNQTVDGVALTNIRSIYWSGTEFDSGGAWRFGFNSGFHFSGNKDGPSYGWAVRSGDIALVPVPPAVWLLATGLMGLLGAAGRKRRR